MFPAGYYRKNINIFNEKLTNGLILLQYDVENFIFSLKYRQRKVDLNTSEKSLVFVTMRQKISYLRKNMHLREDAVFLHFRLIESSENMINFHKFL